MREGFEKYDIARHRHIGQVDLLVLTSDELLTTVRYFSNGVYHTETFNTDELKKKEISRSNINILSGI